MPARGYSYQSTLRRSTRRTPQAGRWRRIIITLLIIGGGGIVLFGWRVRAVEVTGTSLTPSGAIRDAVFTQLQQNSWGGFTPRTRMLLLHPHSIAEDIKRQFRLADVAIHRQMNGVLHIVATEQTVAAISMPVAGTSYLIGETGLLIGPAPDTAFSAKTPTTVIIQTAIPNSTAGTRVLAFEVMDTLRGAWGTLAKLGSSLQPVYASSRSDSPSTIDVTTASGAVISFTTREPIGSQLEKLQILLSNQPTESKHTQFRSIDLRYGDRVYVQ